MAHENSKENQSVETTAYRFGDFELHPSQRLLRCKGAPVAIQPKSFDALLCLLSKADGLVSKKELTDTLWPGTFVSEANLTNIMGGLRKALGRDAIQTVSKHGYRFMLPVAGEPGITPKLYERFARAKELAQLRSLDSLEQARNLLWICIAENPNYAPPWAWLGRCCWLLAKLLPSNLGGAGLTPFAFQRAFLLDPELAIAHQFCTPYQLDTGQVRDAMTRLRCRLQHHPSEPETVTSLVQVLRFRGLLEESLEFHRLAIALDPVALTSVPHTHFFRGDFRASLETYGGRAGYYLDAAAWAALGDNERAQTLLTERITKLPAGALIGSLMGSLLELLHANYSKAAEMIGSIASSVEPEGAILLARHYARMAMAGQAIDLLNEAGSRGFVCAPEMLRYDPWLASVRNHPAFPALLESARAQVNAARAEWKSSGLLASTRG